LIKFSSIFETSLLLADPPGRLTQMNKYKLAILTTLFLTATVVQAVEKTPKIKSDDIPKNEKQLWKKITQSQDEIEANLMSGDPRFGAELALTRRKVADLMLNAEGDKKNKAVVKDLGRAWTFWARETDEIEVEDLKEYNLATAAGKSFNPEDSQLQGNQNGRMQGNNYPPPVYQPNDQNTGYQENSGVQNYNPTGYTPYGYGYSAPINITLGFTWKKGFYEKTSPQPTKGGGGHHQGPAQSAARTTYGAGGGGHRR